MKPDKEGCILRCVQLIKPVLSRSGKPGSADFGGAVLLFRGKRVPQTLLRLRCSEIRLVSQGEFVRGGTQMNSTLKVHTPEARTLIEKIKADIKKRAEAKAKRMLLKRPKRLEKRYG
jgi:hypothetical protein